MNNKLILIGIPALIGIVILLMFGASLYYTVDSGTRGVLSTFGEINPNESPEGLHFKAPWVDVKLVDCRDQQYTVEKIGVPSQDQLTTTMDVTVKWSVNPELAAEAEQSTAGGAAALLDVHLMPKLRSAIRSAGKSVQRAEEFYSETTTKKMETYIIDALAPLADKGILTYDVLIRDINLPPQIEAGVLAKKEREQQAEQQKAELERYKTEQEQLVAEAEAKKLAAVEEAEGKKALADASAYEIREIANAEAEGIKQKADALRASPEVTSYTTALNWDGQLPSTLITSGDSGKSGLMNLITIGQGDAKTAGAAAASR